MVLYVNLIKYNHPLQYLECGNKLPKHHPNQELQQGHRFLGKILKNFYLTQDANYKLYTMQILFMHFNEEWMSINEELYLPVTLIINLLENYPCFGSEHFLSLRVS